MVLLPYVVGQLVLIKAILKNYLFWFIMPCSSLKVNQYFGGLSSGLMSKPNEIPA
jgi:hypothetical protein